MGCRLGMDSEMIDALVGDWGHIPYLALFEVGARWNGSRFEQAGVGPFEPGSASAGVSSSSCNQRCVLSFSSEGPMRGLMR